MNYTLRAFWDIAVRLDKHLGIIVISTLPAAIGCLRHRRA